MIEVEMACVVETGIPSFAATSSTVAAVVSAAKPWIGCNLTTLCPNVLMIRQPPAAVPAAIVSAQITFIQIAISNLGVLRKCNHPGN